MEFRALGSFELEVAGHLATPTAPKVRQVLALLVLEHNKTVPCHHIVDELWGDAPPRQATQTVQTYIYELRRGLRRVCEPDTVLVTKPNGYTVLAPPATVDVTIAEALIRDAGNALADRDPATARQVLVQALAMWRGDPLSNISRGRLLDAHATHLRETWLHALEMRIEADFALNRHHELIGELKALSASNPYNEGIHEKLMLALYRCGRRNEALEVYQRLHRGLAEELGLGPGSQIQRLQQLMLSADPALEPPGSAPQTARPVAVTVSPPAQLPPNISDFVGRDELVARVRRMLDGRRMRAAVPIVSLTGMPGVGKTTAAVYIAHAARIDYPDGQLFVNLGGTSDRPVPVLSALLRSVGIGSALLEDLHEHVAAFRTWAADRRVLLVLDDAESARQVEPLLPSGKGCAVILTNRHPLYGLSSVASFRLGVLSVDDGVELLARIVGPARVAREPEAAADIVRIVGGLPLGIRLLGQRLAAVRSQRLAQFAQRLRGTGARFRLSDLAYVGSDMCARLDTSYRRLDRRDRSAFRLLAVLRDDDFTATDAAEVFQDDVGAAEMTLLRLADVHLVQVVAEDRAGIRRYGLHELVRPYTLECIAGDPHPPVDGMRRGTGSDGGSAWRGYRPIPDPPNFGLRRVRRTAAARSRSLAAIDSTHPRARRPLS